MNVMEKSDIDYAIKYLKAAARNGVFGHRFALNNVVCALEQALERHVEDEQHPHLYLEIVKAPSILDTIIEGCCTTDCFYAYHGTCPYSTTEKTKCPIIQAGMRGYGVCIDEEL
ncbi:MAG: hypothetical protein IJE15_09780 [Bacteroidaceae bacterium]|nr:hypothetical protein [Bacteroidaceae bacterium]